MPFVLPQNVLKSIFKPIPTYKLPNSSHIQALKAEKKRKVDKSHVFN